MNFADRIPLCCVRSVAMFLALIGMAVTIGISSAASSSTGFPSFAPAGGFQVDSARQEPSQKSSPFFTQVRQLTFEGLRSGEGYFSADGQKMIFQSERDPENPFYQMYLMDFAEGDLIRVSPGHGKTTCGWIHPNGEQVLFSSTQDDPESREKQQAKIAEREAGTEGRYSWDYDPCYEIYRYDLATQVYTPLTNAVGYDAEGSYSPDGSKIAFASNRRAYEEGALSETEKKEFEFHQANVMDIYIMNADGSDVQRLTTELGYDGGPFFSPDGKRICWRHFLPDMSSAEIWTMNIDGTDKRQLTQLAATSFAPFYHPSGEYLLFMSNLEGYSNFEIYMVPTQFRGEPVRVTYSDGFDGFPTFSLDGETFSWTSNRVGSKSQIFRARWDHEAALQALAIPDQDQSTASGKATDAQQEGKAAVERTSADYLPEDVLRHVNYLCREELGGRLTGSRGERLATAYVAAYLEHLGFQPAGDVDSQTGTVFLVSEF